MNLTDMLATPIIHLPTATHRGVIDAFGLDERARRIRHVVVIDEDLNEVCYRWEDLLCGHDVMMTNAEPVEEDVARIPFRGAIYDTDGHATGYLKEVTCTDGGRIEQWWSTLDEAIAPSRVVRVGDVVLLRGQTRRNVTPKRKEDTSAPSPADTNTSAASDDAETAPFNLPERGLVRVSGDYTFLLGRTLRDDLVHEGRILLPKGQTIDETVIDTARRHGQLLTLTVLSR